MDLKLVDEWFAHPDWWFTHLPSYDEYITTHYEKLLDDYDSDKTMSVLAKLIILDQLPRHIFRHYNDIGANHIIAWYLQKALHVLSTIDNLAVVDDLTDEHWIFYKLPYRHTNDATIIKDVMKDIWSRIQKQRSGQDIRLLRRFLRATYMMCPTVDQTAFLTLTSSTTIDKTDHDKITTESLKDKYRSILDEKCIDCLTSTKKSKQSIKLNLTDMNDQVIIVSLSGGVDSMVLLNMLIKQFTNKHVVAIHINYCNRGSSNMEAQFVADYCTLRKVTCYTRYIDEVQREPCKQLELRELYETYTKRVRFGSYKTVGSMYGLDKPCIYLGHNLDDCFENVLTNVVNHSKYSNLRGMDQSTDIDNVVLVRPLLNISKKDIYAYAHTHNIPFVYDSTPSDCQRGRIRDTIVPTLNTDCIKGFIDLSLIMSQLYDIMKSSVSAFLLTIDGGKCEKLNSLSESPVFWRELLGRLNHYVSHKSITTLCENVKRMKVDGGRAKKHVRTTILSKQVRVVLTIDYTMGTVITKIIE